MQKLIDYQSNRINVNQADVIPLFWSDEFQEVTTASESGYRPATLEELKLYQKRPLRPTEAFQVQEGVFLPVAISQNRHRAITWSYEIIPAM